jgi:Stage II sporulation protein E (SpoIIE)
MAGWRTSRLDLAGLLAAVEDAPPVAAADVLGACLADAFGASEVTFLIADFSGGALIRLGHAASPAATRTRGDETAERVAVAGTPHGRALAGQTVVVAHGRDEVRLYAPVTNRGEAIGLVELVLDESPDEEMVADIALAAHMLAYVIIANRRFTDLFEWGKRSVPLSLAAEIQHRLLPGAYTCEAGQFTLAGWLEPAGNVGGDTFDFAVDRHTLHVSMSDAMGHTVEAAVLASVLVGALRNARRAGVGLDEQAERANAALCDYVTRGEFVTGQVARVDLDTGTATIVNAGHPPPMRLRDRRAEPVPLRPDLPFGTARDTAYRAQELGLRPGDGWCSSPTA